MPSVPVNMDSARTRADLAAPLGVPAPALASLSLRPTQCRSAGCALSATENNGGRSILCSQTWVPRTCSAYRRGHGLFGNQFLRGFEGRVPLGVAQCAHAGARRWEAAFPGGRAVPGRQAPVLLDPEGGRPHPRVGIRDRRAAVGEAAAGEGAREPLEELRPRAHRGPDGWRQRGPG